MITYLCVKIDSSLLKRLWEETRPRNRAMFVDIKPSTALNSERIHFIHYSQNYAQPLLRTRGFSPSHGKGNTTACTVSLGFLLDNGFSQKYFNILYESSENNIK